MFIKVVSIIVTCFAVCLNSFSENEVSYDFVKATETGKITLGKLAVIINNAGIVSIRSGDKVLTENINCYFTGLDWKLIWDPLRISGERSIELLETNGGKYFISTQVFSPSDSPAIKVKTRIELSKAGILSVLYNFEQPDGTAILNNCVVFIGNYYDKIYCTDIKGQEREIISLPGSVTAPKEIKISTGNQHWTVTNDVLKNWSAVVIGDKKGYLTYRFKSNTPSSFGLNFNFSEFTGTAPVSTAVAKPESRQAPIPYPILENRKKQGINLLNNGGFEFGMNSWLSMGHSFDEWQVTDTESHSGRHCLMARPYKEWKDGFLERNIIKALISDLVQTGGKPHCASLWMKGAGNPVVKVSLGKISRSFNITGNWVRYIIEPNSSERGSQMSQKDVALSVGTVIKSGQSIFIDDAVITEGALLPEKVISPDCSVVPETNRVGNIFEKGSESNITVTGVNIADVAKELSVKYEIKNYWGQTVKDGVIKYNISPGGEELQTINPVLNENGYFEIVFSALTDEKKQTKPLTTLTYSVMTAYSKQDSKKGREIFGIVADFPRMLDQNIEYFTEIMVKTGVTSVRDHCWGWEVAEAEKGTFKWKEFDFRLKAMEDAGLDLTPTLGRWYNAKSWNGQTGEYLQALKKENLGDWGDFIYQIVSRYKGRIKYWEVWNEPDHSVKRFKTDPAFYTDLLKITYEKAKAADPECRIAGMCTSYLDWAEAVIRGGGLNYLDIISFHSYYYAYNAEESLKWLSNLKKIVARYSNGKEVDYINTEIGTYTQKRGYSETNQSDFKVPPMLAQYYIINKGGDVKKVFWFAAATRMGYSCGLFYNERGNIVPAPGLTAYNHTIRMLDGTVFVQKETGGALKLYRFNYYGQDGKALIALWYDGIPDKRNLVLPLNTEMEIYDVMGGRISPKKNGGSSVIELITSIPVYIKTDTAGADKIMAAKLMDAVAEEKNEAKGAAGKISPSSGPFKPGAGGWITDWMLLGPFPNPGTENSAAGFNKDYLPALGGESKTIITKDTRINFKWPPSMLMLERGLSEDGEANAIAYHGSGLHAMSDGTSESRNKEKALKIVNIINSMIPNNHVAAYAFCYIVSDNDTDAIFKIGSDDGNKVWLNGTLIGSTRAFRGCAEDSDVYPCVLKRGVNVLLIKIEQNAGGWEFQCRFTDRSGKPLEDINIWL